MLDLHAKLSANFTVGELLATSKRQFLTEQGEAPPVVLLNLKRLTVDVLQPMRDLVGGIWVTSGYRCPGLNAAVGGHKQSAHLEGRAADCLPLDMQIVDAYNRIAKSAIPYDKMILESKEPKKLWIHVQVASHWKTPRRQLFMKWPDTDFLKYNPNDQRVKNVGITVKP